MRLAEIAGHDLGDGVGGRTAGQRRLFGPGLAHGGGRQRVFLRRHAEIAPVRGENRPDDDDLHAPALVGTEGQRPGDGVGVLGRRLLHAHAEPGEALDDGAAQRLGLALLGRLDLADIGGGRRPRRRALRRLLRRRRAQTAERIGERARRADRDERKIALRAETAERRFAVAQREVGPAGRGRAGQRQAARRLHLRRSEHVQRRRIGGDGLAQRRLVLRRQSGDRADIDRALAHHPADDAGIASAAERLRRAEGVAHAGRLLQSAARGEDEGGEGEEGGADHGAGSGARAMADRLRP